MRKTTLMAVAAVAVLATAALAADKPEYGTWGQDMTSFDKAVKPGDDFFKYVVGTWLKNEPIPADRTFTGIDLTIDNTLKPRLKGLVESGLLERRRYQERPPRFEYVLTDRGRDFRPVLWSLLSWGNRHFAPEGASVQIIDEFNWVLRV